MLALYKYAIIIIVFTLHSPFADITRLVDINFYLRWDTAELVVVVHTENCVLSFIQRTVCCHSYRELGVVIHTENRALSFMQRTGRCHSYRDWALSFILRTSYREQGVVIHTENWALSFIQRTGHCHSYRQLGIVTQTARWFCIVIAVDTSFTLEKFSSTVTTTARTVII